MFRVNPAGRARRAGRAAYIPSARTREAAMQVLVPAALVAVIATGATAAQIPRIDFEKTCRDTPATFPDRKSSFDQCMNDERQARGQLPAAWSQASATARAQCSALTQLGGASSYVELITCLEMENPALGARPPAARARTPQAQPVGAKPGG